MTPHVLALLGLLVAAIILFAVELLPAELTAATLLVALYFVGLLPANQLFAGFGSDAVLFLGSLFVVSHALVRTGALERVELFLARHAERRPRLMVPQLVAGTALVSAFLSNTATVVAVLPVASSLARRLRIAPSKLFMPLSFASILGGSLTLIGTSTNIVVAGAMPRFGERPWGLFELTPVALPATVLGLVYLLTVGRRLLPERSGDVAELYRFREYVSEVVVPIGSRWAGQTLRELRAGAELDVTVLGRVVEGGVEAVEADRAVAVGDRLLVKAGPEALLRLRDRSELGLRPALAVDTSAPRSPMVHEAVLAHASRLSGRTLRDLDFAARYGVVVLALFRRGEPLLDRIASVRLRDGDVLLLQGDLARLDDLLRARHLILLEQKMVPAPSAKLWIAVGSFLGMLLVGGARLLPFPIVALVAALVVLLAGCVTPRQAYEAIDWGVLVLVGSLLGLAVAMETSGAGRLLAGYLAGAAGDFGPLALLAGFYVLTVVLTQPMSNQAAALVVLPLALYTARQLGLQPRAFAAAVTLAASCSFVTPLEPASLLVYGPGRYRFADFFKVGLPLTLLVLVLNLWLVSRLFPLRPPH